ncbi:hypothetical protein K491DRAFT_160081 [Lophiostoma macrostomum CBS 122681]|uniref:Uncharacterized protein n=1 Tax=Lophiostoma macrostomum CBS 122681 TaxID=1314788 RepID=A0A6A6SSC3_9PLEO|nr:hypothetical protein K491DRAFT_160081 [Lophiostoma macrostomum CBS 122681]
MIWYWTLCCISIFISFYYSLYTPLFFALEWERSMSCWGHLWYPKKTDSQEVPAICCGKL